MSSLAVNALRASSLGITVARYGPWAADVVLAGDQLLPTAKFGCRVVLGDLALTGTVFRQASFGGSVRARIVGGALGWRNVIPAAGYDHSFGVLRSSVIKDAAQEVGEKVNIAVDGVIGPHYVRFKAKAERVLRILSGGQWWIDADGVTQVRPRPTRDVKGQYTATQRQGGSGRFEIATENFSEWMPGARFVSKIVPDVQEVSTVIFHADKEGGAARVCVLTGDSEADRLLSDVRAIIQAELASLAYSGVWEYRIASGDSDKVSAVPTDKRMPDLTNVEMLPGLLGEKVTPKPGSLCRLAFVNADPSRPFVMSIDGDPILAEMKALVTKIGDGLLPAVKTGDFAGPFPCIGTAVRLML